MGMKKGTRPRRSRLTDMEYFAYHEAAHAVAAYVHGRRFFVVTIDKSATAAEGSGVRGFVHYVPWEYDLEDDEGQRPAFDLTLPPEIALDGIDMDEPPMPLSVLEREMVIVSAGVVVLRILRGSSLFYCRIMAGDGDADSLRRALALVDDDQRRRAENRWVRRSLSLLRVPAHWAAVEAVAMALLEKQTLLYAEAEAIIEAAMEMSVGEEN